MGDTQTDSKTSVSFNNVKVSSLNDDGEAVAKFAFNVNVTCEYDPEGMLIRLCNEANNQTLQEFWLSRQWNQQGWENLVLYSIWTLKLLC